MPDRYRSLSLWLDALPEDLAFRSALATDETCDVAIVGAGYSGLWTAYYLSKLQPERRIVIVEAEIAGFGASGRNGGWCSGGLNGIEGLLARPERRAAGMRLQRAAYDAVDEIGRVCAAEAIDCDYRKGGSLRTASNAVQREGLDAYLEALREWGLGPEDYRLLEPEELAGRLKVARNFGALFTPHCAAIQPALLARGLARAVEARGVEIFEGSPATRVESGRVVTPRAELRADLVVRATEGYTHQLPGHARRLVPLHSMMIATEPLSDAVWKEIGLAERETFGDGRRIVIYGQRTADGRIAFGSRASYRLGSRVEDRFDPNDARFRGIRDELVDLLPVLADAEITHRWGGPLGVPRNWRPAVGLDREARLAWAGGYVGQGVAASNLAGRTLAELIVGADTERCKLPWVGGQWRRWEPEPLRWLAVAGITTAGGVADRSELRRGRRSRLAGAIFDAFVDH